MCFIQTLVVLFMEFQWHYSRLKCNHMITMFSNGSIHSSCVQKCCMSSFKYQEYVQLSTHLAKRY